ncbi:MAG: hypothetical protein K0U63_05015 [Cyanobacteria bacterium]|jgi:hypothetical protein|nr:hypothetical protein [Cyanobacteriota bacterium]
MQVEVRLVHAEPGTRVVEATALQRGERQAMALGEADTAEAAEDRARERLQHQLASGPAGERPEDASTGSPPRTPSPAPAAKPAAPAQAPAPAPAPAAAAAEEPPPDPEDWSAELARIDLALKRIGWQREQEALYLERAFGHPSRSRLTTYNDLLAYLDLVEALEPPCDPASAPVPLRRRDLLSQSDALLAQLGWTALQGRQFLEHHLGPSSRQQLSDAQLLQFNMLLEEALMAAHQPAPPAGA